MRHGPCTAWWRPCKPAAWSPTRSQRARPSSWACVGWLLAPLIGRESEREILYTVSAVDPDPDPNPGF
jgi:hypothetical protein